MAEARGRLRAVLGMPVRAVRRTNGKQRAAGGAAGALLLTAPFGGLQAVQGEDVYPLEIGERMELGQYDLTVTDVASVDTLGPYPAPQVEDVRQRFLVIAATWRNDGTEPAYVTQLTRAIGGKGFGVVPWDDEEDVRLVVLGREDGVDLSTLNPGLERKVFIVAPQAADWTKGPAELSVIPSYFRAEDPLTLDPDSWQLDDATFVGDVDVKMVDVGEEGA